MIWIVAFTESLRDILSHKIRSLLTILGVVLGSSALMTMNGIVEGMAVGMRHQMLATGDHRKVTIQPAEPPSDQTLLAVTSPGLTLRDARTIEQKVALAQWVSPLLQQRVRAVFEDRDDRTILSGATLGYLQQENHDTPYGRFFSELDIQSRNRVCVLGGRIYEKLFPFDHRSALGASILINGHRFEVIGIFPFYLSLTQKRQLESGIYQKQVARSNREENRSRFLTYDAFPSKNDRIVIPITTFQEIFKAEQTDTQVIGDDIPISAIQVGCADMERVDDLIDQLRSLMLLLHNDIEDFQIDHNLDRLEEVDQQVQSSRLSGLLIAGIGLVVGGVGIANIMLASLADRIREIGIRRTVGARATDIFGQVMLEALILAALGGVLGILLSWGIIFFLSDVARIPNQPIVTPGALLFSFSFSLLTGFLAGIYPALKASALRPVEALRYH